MEWLPGWIDLALRVAGILGGVFSTVGMVAIWAIRQSLVTRDQMQAHVNRHAEEHRTLDKRLEDGERRFATIQKDLEHLPDADHWAELTGRVIAVEGSVNTMSAKFDGLKEVVERIEVPLNIIVENYIKGAQK